MELLFLILIAVVLVFGFGVLLVSRVRDRHDRGPAPTPTVTLERPPRGGVAAPPISVEEEETEIFPELKSALARDEWLALGDAIADAKAAAGKPVGQAPSRKSNKRQTTSSRK